MKPSEVETRLLDLELAVIELKNLVRRLMKELINEA